MPASIFQFPGLLPRFESDPDYATKYPWVGVVDRMMTKNRRTPIPLSKYIARRISSTLNRDFRMMFVGQPGSGKSWAALYLAEKIAEHLAEIHGKPASTFFSGDNIIYGTPEEVQTELQLLKRYNVYVLDDIGVSINSREFASQVNKWFSNVFQTCRTDNTALLLTLPDTFLVDKVPRSLIQYLAEMQITPHVTRARSTTTAKIFTVSKNYRTNKTYYQYLRFGDRIYSTHTFLKPSDSILMEYEKIRLEVAKTAKKRKNQSIPIESAAKAILKISLSENCSVCHATKLYTAQTGNEVPYRRIYQRLYKENVATKRQREQLAIATPPKKNGGNIS